MPRATTAATMGSPRLVHHAARRFVFGAALTRRDRSRQWLASPHEGADELTVDGADGLGTEPGADQEVARAFRRVDARRLQVDVFEPGLRELGAVLGLLERAGNAPDPQLDAATDL